MFRIIEHLLSKKRTVNVMDMVGMVAVLVM